MSIICCCNWASFCCDDSAAGGKGGGGGAMEGSLWLSGGLEVDRLEDEEDVFVDDMVAEPRSERKVITDVPANSETVDSDTVLSHLVTVTVYWAPH